MSVDGAPSPRRTAAKELRTLKLVYKVERGLDGSKLYGQPTYLPLVRWYTHVRLIKSTTTPSWYVVTRTRVPMQQERSVGQDTCVTQVSGPRPSTFCFSLPYSSSTTLSLAEWCFTRDMSSSWVASCSFFLAPPPPPPLLPPPPVATALSCRAANGNGCCGSKNKKNSAGRKNAGSRDGTAGEMLSWCGHLARSIA